MSDSNKAVFLGYASQDAAAELAGALRAAGVDVWFDQSELRGGDAQRASMIALYTTCRTQAQSS